MANNKKKKTKKTQTRKITKAPVKKIVKKTVEDKKDKTEDTSKVFKDFIVLLIVLSGVFIVVYGLTVGAHKLGWFDTRYTKPEVEEAKISYDKINAGTMFNRQEENYYVLIGDFKENSMYITEIVKEYKEKENAKKVYYVDINDGMNSYLKSEESATTSSYPSRLAINDFTLIEVRNNNNVASYVGVDKINEILK